MNSAVRRWPLLLIGATTAVAVWSGWVALDQLLASMKAAVTAILSRRCRADAWRRTASIMRGPAVCGRAPHDRCTARCWPARSAAVLNRRSESASREDSGEADQILRVVGRGRLKVGKGKSARAVSAVVRAYQAEQGNIRRDRQQLAVRWQVVARVLS